MNLLDIFFPKFCVGCQGVGSYLCTSCTQQLTQKELICPECKTPALGGQTHPLCQTDEGLDGLWSLGAYQGALKDAIQKLKYRWVGDLAEPLVDTLINYWVYFSPHLLEKLIQDRGEGWRIVPVPLHPKRQKWRGFNQSALLGQILAKRLGLPYHQALIRTRYTTPQVTFKSQERRQNLKDAFQLQGEVPQKAIVVDDVWTTGSTLQECCRTLKKEGCKVVWGLTLAR